MSSRAFKAFKLKCRQAARLTSIALDKRLRPIGYEDSEPALHAALAIYVSALESYIELLCLEILEILYENLDANTKIIIEILRSEANKEIKKFNTPNYENCRSLLLRFTGYDPLNEMQAQRIGMNSQVTKTRLDEILKVRHSFAHGAPIPSFTWLTKYGVKSRLSKNSVEHAGKVIRELVNSIDKGAEIYIKSTFSINPPWQ